MVEGDYTEVFEGVDGQWYWHRKAANHEVIAQSEGFTTKQHAVRAATRVFGDDDLRSE
jgi:uncharacterized protein YegP (UPF0339 family)